MCVDFSDKNEFDCLIYINLQVLVIQQTQSLNTLFDRLAMVLPLHGSA